ncbi:hypothetical protein [Aneurinibacillus terranovensis]|uniref:hypothetical protein n=1 Tax=Aneurinibacillus terranovensis TaxID=278991 RepID=UPI0004055B20|nr:hypothetical protein [Aneurinibacillus terranovensis]
MDAVKLSYKVRKIIDKHIRQKGYETDATLEHPATGVSNRNQLSITDTGQPVSEQIPIKIVVTAHDEMVFPMELGDNPNEILDFIVIEDEMTPDKERVKEGGILVYQGKRYTVTLAAPATLAGNLIIKECRGKLVK